MNEKELYQQKKQAQLDEWKAEIAKLRAQASGASADAELELNRQIGSLEDRIEEGKSKLDDVADTSENAWEATKDGVESAWNSMESAFNDVVARFKK